MKVKLILSLPERTMIVAALMSFDANQLASKIAEVEPFDPADDGPEVELLRAVRESSEARP